MGEWIVDVISFQKIFGLCGLKGHIVEIRRGVTLVDDARTDGRNVKIELEFWKQNSQYTAAMGAFDIRLLSAFDLQFRCNLASSLFGFDPKSN